MSTTTGPHMVILVCFESSTRPRIVASTEGDEQRVRYWVTSRRAQLIAEFIAALDEVAALDEEERAA